MAAPEFFTDAWADAVRAALEAGPPAEVRAGVLPEYWAFFERTRAEHAASWALGVRDLPGRGPSYLFLRWADGGVAECRVIGPDDPLAATYVLAGSYAAWRELLGGYDAKKTVMYRRLLLEEGDLLEFFTTIYFFVECLAQIGRVPTSFPAEVPAEVPLSATG